MRFLILGPEQKAAIQKVRSYASKHVVTLDDLKATMAGSKMPVGDDPNYVVKLPVGITAVFSLEEQPIGICRHLSVSVNTEGKYPNIHVMDMLLKEFGFKAKFTEKNPHFKVWDEKDAQAINVLELI